MNTYILRATCKIADLSALLLHQMCSAASCLPLSLPLTPHPLPPLYCRHQNSAVRTSAAHCLAALASAWMDALMPPLLRLLLPRLGSPDDATRLGAVEAVVQV